MCKAVFLFTPTAVVGKGSFTVLLVNNGEIAYIPKGITIAGIFYEIVVI